MVVAGGGAKRRIQNHNYLWLIVRGLAIKPPEQLQQTTDRIGPGG